MSQKANHSTLLTCLLLSASAAFVSSCQDYEPFTDVQDKAYTHEFERQFGKIDPEQNWDLFGQLARRRNRSTRAGTDNPYYSQVVVTNLNSDEDAIIVTREDNQEYNKVLPEGAGGALAYNQNLRYEDTNLGRVVQDFVATAHQFTIAPVHWTTSGNDVIGIYWYTDDESEADETIMGADGELYWIVLKPIITGKTRLQYHNASGIHDIPTGPTDCGHVFTQYNADYLVSHPVQVTVPEEIPYYGFYMHQDNLGNQYSESKLNRRINISNFGDKQPCYVATFNIQRDIDADYPDDRDYLCFEDWLYNGDFDLNDLVFRVEGFDNQSIMDQSVVNETAILVCEDLTEYDFDFNDIALLLNYTEEIDRVYKFISSGQGQGHYELDPDQTTETKQLTVTAVAAGGAFESTLKINGTEWGEIHALLNETTAEWDGQNKKRHKIINASPIYTDRKGKSIVIPKEDLPNKNVGTGEGQYPTYLSQLFDTEGFFAIHSEEDGDAVKLIQSHSFKGKGEGTAPQMMLLPEYFEWPLEQAYICDAYSGFTDWVEDVSQTNWILNSQVSDKVTDRGDLTPITTPDTPSEVTESFDLRINSDSIFIWNQGQSNQRRYENGVFLDLSKIELEANDNATAKLHITYSTYPSNRRLYIDDAAGREILSHNPASGENHTVVTYSISAAKLLLALQTKGIWIVDRNDLEIHISSAVIDIHNETTEVHHKLFVDPLYMTYETMNPQTITAYSATGATITFTSSDESVVTVPLHGTVGTDGYVHVDVTPVAAEGYASIIVRAEASTVPKEIKATTERVSIEIIMGDENRVVLKLGATNDIAGATGNLTNYALCTTARDVMDDWSNGAILTVTKTAGNAAYFQIRNVNNDVVGQAVQTNDRANFTLSYAQLQRCKNSDGTGYTFKIVHSENTYIQSAVLNKQ